VKGPLKIAGKTESGQLAGRGKKNKSKKSSRKESKSKSIAEGKRRVLEVQKRTRISWAECGSFKGKRVSGRSNATLVMSEKKGVLPMEGKKKHG